MKLTQSKVREAIIEQFGKHLSIEIKSSQESINGDNGCIYIIDFELCGNSHSACVEMYGNDTFMFPSKLVDEFFECIKYTKRLTK